jgi:Transposase
MEGDGGGLSHLLGQGLRRVEHVVTWGLEHRTFGQIDAIGVDEIQYSKGHKYLTLVYQIDLGVTRLLCVGKERTIESFQGFFTTIGKFQQPATTCPNPLDVSLTSDFASVCFGQEVSMKKRITTKAFPVKYLTDSRLRRLSVVKLPVAG